MHAPTETEPLVNSDNPIATIAGQAFVNLPQDLYIPPDALRVFLEAFEGPLDLLLYLIKKQNLDILNIPIAEITRQYLHYIDLMQNLQFELAAEYLLMAAVLAEIKSRLLLPRLSEHEEEEDPRAELIRRLKEYEQFKQAAEQLDQLPRVERDIFPAYTAPPTEFQTVKALPTVHLNDLLLALSDILSRVELRHPHLIERELLSVREKMTQVLQYLGISTADFISFHQVLIKSEGRQGVVVALIAVLELLKQSMIEVVQIKPYGEIHIQKKM